MRYLSISLVFISMLLFTGCDFLDFTGLFYSSPVNDRFREKDRLKVSPAPAVADPDHFSFAVVADTHYWKTPLNYLTGLDANKNNWGISFASVAGDVVQSGLKESFELVQSELNSISLPVYFIPGNHDLYYNGYDHYKNYFGRTIYDYKIGQTHILFLDTANGTLGSLQTEWLEERLKNSGCRFKIIISHYSLTDKGFDQGTSTSYPEETYALFDLFDRFDVNYYICGHLHDYDEKLIRGVRYVLLNNTVKDSKTHLKITVEGSRISHTFVR